MINTSQSDLPCLEWELDLTIAFHRALHCGVVLFVNNLHFCGSTLQNGTTTLIFNRSFEVRDFNYIQKTFMEQLWQNNF